MQRPTCNDFNAEILENGTQRQTYTNYDAKKIRHIGQHAIIATLKHKKIGGARATQKISSLTNKK